MAVIYVAKIKSVAVQLFTISIILLFLIISQIAFEVFLSDALSFGGSPLWEN